MSFVNLLSPAKINLALRVHGRRADGYHEITSVIQPVNLFDTVKIEVAEGNGILLNTRGINIPNDKSNLAYKAAMLYLEKTDVQKKITISIDKSVPTGSGLGGGSSNAAAVLVGLNRLLNALNENELMKISSQLGADVPFFIKCQSAIVEGIGEKITILKNFPLFHYVVIYPKFGVSTAEVYKEWDKLNGGCNNQRPELEKLKQNFLDPELEPLVFNDLERPSFSICPALKKYKELMHSLNTKLVMISGSGSSFFTLFRQNKPAEELYKYLSSSKEIDTFLLKGISGWHRLAY